MHGLGNYQFMKAGVVEFAILQESGDDAGHTAA